MLPTVQAGNKDSLVLKAEQLKNKETAIEALLDDWLFLRDHSGSRWGGETQIITAPVTAWARYYQGP